MRTPRRAPIALRLLAQHLPGNGNFVNCESLVRSNIRSEHKHHELPEFRFVIPTFLFAHSNFCATSAPPRRIGFADHLQEVLRSGVASRLRSLSGVRNQKRIAFEKTLDAPGF